MANIKSAKKRIGVTQKKTEQNKSAKSKLNTEIKKFKAAPTKEGYSNLTSLIDKAAQDNLMHENKASRLKARYAKMVKTA